ncbi:MAG: ATP-binding cassette domain-containing protein [Tannerellaceae bacterium]|jgi:ABC-type uncharacterized transport system ATPase component|nr:ATP-binding cassette domain-containing protein [Tannerellaceae bacterium]
MAKGYDININNLRFTPPKGNEKGILRGISFTVTSGEFVSFIGRNGHGKTSIFKAILGELNRHHIEGEIKVGNTVINKSIHELCGGVGIVHQYVQDDLIPELTILKNIQIRMANSTNKEVRKNAFEEDWKQQLNAILADFLKTDDFTPTNDQLIENLSGGQRQLLNILISIKFEHSSTIGCKLLLLDEHLTSLDKVIQKKVMELVMKLTGRNPENNPENKPENKPTILMITHDFEYALQYSNSIIVVYEGVVKERIEKSDRSKWTTGYLNKVIE